MRTLSKSKLIAYRQCPKRLWLEIHKPELRDDSCSEAAFAAGHQVGEVARQVFDKEGTGVNLDPHQIGWDASAEQTKELIQTGGRHGFEAFFSIPGAMALADVMRPVVDYGALAWEMIEVKGSASVKDYQRDDVAIQTYIAEKNGVPLSKSCLAHIDTSFVYQGDQNYDGLFNVVDLTEEARERANEVETWIREAQAIAALDEAPEIEVGEQCKNPFPCGFCAHCHEGIEAPEDPFGMLPRLSWKKRESFELQGFETLDELPDDQLSETQAWIKDIHLSGQTYFDKERAQAVLEPYPFPAYFLDYETVAFAVPIWTGSRPYQNLPFQYSLHRVDADGKLDHKEFLELSGSDPREALARQLTEDCGDTGPIYVYNAKFERGVTQELADNFPELRGSLENILERIVDLHPIAKSCYYHPSQNGKWGLKAVAPAIAPEIRYDELVGVQVGSDAGLAYLEACAPETTPERREELRRQMLEYCKLDTLATVKIWEFFRA